ncbi:putative potassium-activated aldehyde dehydrogenase [Triangularia verruculosa]|uniref:aldehyde dehydrogenase (NAD(+)) n=1 Tax=Triangularia verruculosa TaxID=2587418 RepID=A0AAN7AYV9_9PEZI|nr:putative potassium-activated aldehyde dehydrogenase [Triangularia verruculosa]
MGSITDLPKIDFTSNFQNIIGNALSSTPETRQAVDPSTEELLYPVPVSKQPEVDKAVSAAKAAFPAWRELSFDERAQYILRYADAIEANLFGLQELLMKEAGKPVSNAAGELGFALAHLRETAKLRLEDEVIEDNEERKASVRYIPVGVGVGIVPWNYPVLLGVGKLGPAVLSGNTFIWKPSPYSPYTALKLGEIAAQIFPPGVVQVLSGDESLGPLFTTHPDVAKISFTGSTATGKKVMQACAGTLKRLTLELGGNDAAVVCEDVDVEKVVQKIGPMAFMHSGQICMDIKRLYIHEKIYDQFLAALVQVVKSFKVGGGGDPEAFLGPVQNSMQFAKVKDLYSEISKQNWQVAVGGEPVGSDKRKGFFLPPTIIDNPPDDSRIVVEEPFGPIMPVLKWRDEDDVVKRANNTNMGLGASVWSNDIARAEKLAKRLEAGSIWVNSHFELSPYVPFGGHKWSGVGMDWGIVGMKGWCNTQASWVRKTI